MLKIHNHLGLQMYYVLVGYLASSSFLHYHTILNSILCTRSAVPTTLRINNLGSYVCLNQTTSQDHLESVKQLPRREKRKTTESETSENGQNLELPLATTRGIADDSYVL